MARLTSLQDLTRDRKYDFRTEGIFDPTGLEAYGSGGSKIGIVRGAMVDADTGQLRYLMVDAGGWFSSKEVLVPVGLARIEDDAVFFDDLTKEQVRDMREYREGDAYDDAAQLEDERVLLGASNAAPPERSAALYETPHRLRLLEERLVVDKERFVAGQVEVGKHVENREQQVSVNVSHEEVVIERHPVSDARPAQGEVLGDDRQVIRVDLEAERANVRKQAFVTEEVEVSERAVSETRTFEETVGREVLDVRKEGEAVVGGEAALASEPVAAAPALGTSRITAVFDSEAQAEQAITELRRDGVTDAHLSVIRRHDAQVMADRRDDGDGMSGAGEGLLAGAGIGALFGLGAALIPGVGPFIAGGALATSLGAAGTGAVAGAVVGGVAGTLAGALADAGYDREEAGYYADAVERGGVLVAVENTSGLPDARIVEILERHGGRQYR